jgi:hypothetical protein
MGGFFFENGNEISVSIKPGITLLDNQLSALQEIL